MLFQASLGIDIQEKSVAIAYLKASFRGPRLVAHGIFPIEDELPSREKMLRLGQVVQTFLDKHKISSATYYLGIPREKAIVRYAEFPLVVKENLRGSLRYELEKYVPFPADELYFDYQVISEDKKSEKLRLVLLAVKREFIDAYISLLKHSSLRLSGIEVSSTALSNFFAALPEPIENDAYSVIYGRDGGIELALLKSGFLSHSRPFQVFQGDPDSVSQVMQGLRRIKEELKDHEGPLKTVVCNVEGMSTLLSGLKEDEAFDVRLFDFSSTNVPSADLIPAYGLALKGIQDLPTDVNLLPSEMRKKPNKLGYYTMFGLAGLVMVLALGWIGGMIFNTQRYVKQLDHELGRLQAQAANLEQTEAECNRIKQRIDALNPLRRNRLAALDVIKELSGRIPKNAWLLRLTYSDKDNKIQIEGWADSASELIPALDDSPIFRDVGFLSSITKNREGNERFRIGLELER
ncbi:MAG: pilus assembly protein PilM [Deltaproteobacteria bacterium]|nr:pilus assembly protein PilM [Deltaproteobacteria bacterium]